MSNAIEGLKPALVWKYFAESAKIPHGSKNEAAIAKYVLGVAKSLGLAAKQDQAGSVIVSKPATAGRAGVRSVCLQGHLDMVCEKNADKKHDFLKDPITLVRKGNALMADGTTLGGDNGIAVATNLALMETKDVEHGPLELLFTIDEETGLTGANNLEPGFVTSRTLLNLDSEEEGSLCVGCAGGRDSVATFQAAFDAVPAGMVAADLVVKGLKGGHSGLDIAKGRANALKLLARTLAALGPCGVRVSELAGGSKRNAIPREATAACFFPKAKLKDAEVVVRAAHDLAKNAFGTTDPEVTIALEKASARKGKVLKRALVAKVVKTLTALPHGVIRMSPDIKDLVETSTNVAVIETTKKAVVLATSQRSSVASELTEMVATVHSILELAGADIEHSKGYPGWKPDLGSPVLKVAKETYQKLFGREPHVYAVHAGLECGIIGEKYPGIDMVSIGPTLEAVHSPDEKIFVDTVPRFWDFLLAILKNIK